MKPLEAWRFFVERFFNIDLLYLIEAGLVRYSHSSRISFSKFLFLRNLSISSTFSKYWVKVVQNILFLMAVEFITLPSFLVLILCKIFKR